MTASGHEDVDELLRLEEELLWAGGPHQRDRIEELLHPAFVEIGASGRRWECGEVVAALADREPPFDRGMRRTEVTALAPGVVLVVYEALLDHDRSLRSSVWLRTDGGWRIRFHQGTSLPDDEDD